jgi:hypothetical protein
LRSQVVNFVGLGLLDYAPDSGGIAQVAVMKLQSRFLGCIGLAKMVDTASCEARTAAHNAVYLIAFFKQEFGKVRTVLPGHSGYQCDLCHGNGAGWTGQSPFASRYESLSKCWVENSKSSASSSASI